MVNDGTVMVGEGNSFVNNRYAMTAEPRDVSYMHRQSDNERCPNIPRK